MLGTLRDSFLLINPTARRHILPCTAGKGWIWAPSITVVLAERGQNRVPLVCL